MNKAKSSRKAFTLIEILVATAIFATVMVIVVATFSWAAGYNNRLKETRRVGQEVRNAMDLLTRDIRLANGSGNVKIGSINYDIGEITLMLCDTDSSTSCVPVLQNQAGRYKNDLAATADPSGTSSFSNAILILKKDSQQAVFYRSTSNSGSVENYKFYIAAMSGITDFDALDLSSIYASDNTVTTHPDDNTISIQVFFGGYGATKESRNQQPYAEIYLIGKTYNYGSVQPMMRSKFHLRTMVETRDYNP